jgi:hypothetical protein
MEPRYGPFTLSVDIAGLAGGMYLYKVVAGNKSSSKKMIVLK